MRRNVSLVLACACACLQALGCFGCVDNLDRTWLTGDDCNPPCASDEICVRGVCVRPGPDADADDGSRRDADADARRTDDSWREDVVVPEDDAGADEDEDDFEEDSGDVPLNTGDPCTTTDECHGPDPICITTLPTPIGEVVFPGGYCSFACTPAGTECGPDGYCLDMTMAGGPMGCAKTCETSADCREAEGYLCTNFGLYPENMCAPPMF